MSFDRRSYLYEGEDLVQMLRSSPHADWFATAAYLEQVGSEDIIYAFVPMVRLGEALGVDLPVTRAMVEVMGVMLQRDYWARGARARRPRARRPRPRGGPAVRDDRAPVTRWPLRSQGKDLRLDEVVAVARGRETVALAADALERMARARALADASAARGHATYGLTTGLGVQKRVTAGA